MSTFESNRPFFISVIAPFMMAYGLLGIMYSLSHLGLLQAVPEIESFLSFIQRAIGKTSVPTVSILIISSLLKFVGGIGLWSMRVWGAIMSLLACGFIFFEFYETSSISPYIIGFTALLALAIIMHYKDFD
jgi:hypothetical protein